MPQLLPQGLYFRGKRRINLLKIAHKCTSIPLRAGLDNWNVLYPQKCFLSDCGSEELLLARLALCLLRKPAEPRQFAKTRAGPRSDSSKNCRFRGGLTSKTQAAPRPGCEVIPLFHNLSDFEAIRHTSMSEISRILVGAGGDETLFGGVEEDERHGTLFFHSESLLRARFPRWGNRASAEKCLETGPA